MWSRETDSERDGDSMGPSQGWLAGWAIIFLQVGIGESGTHGPGWASTSDLEPIPDFSRPLQGWAGIWGEMGSHSMNRSWCWGVRAESSKNTPREALPLPWAYLTCVG